MQTIRDTPNRKCDDSQAGDDQKGAPAGTAFAGFGAGVLVMYATAFLVQV